ncbi:MAG TPA: hypothetical protein VIZ18_13765, partial [Ktedonobacteraceae bacterium]
LLAAQLVYQIEQICGRRIAATTLLAEPNIEYLANVIDGSKHTSQDVVSDDPERMKAKRPLFPWKERLRQGHQK